MATYTLSGAGVQALSSGVVALHVTIATLPSPAGHGSANPSDYYGVGLLRASDGVGFWDPYPIFGGPQWMPLPYSATAVGYSIADGASVSVAEVLAPAPLAWPLASLPDVALSSPSDAQVLTYQGSSHRWVNAAAPSGGGGTGFAPPQSIFLTTNIALTSTGVWVDCLQLTLGAGKWQVIGAATVVCGGATTINARLWDGTTTFKTSENTTTGVNAQTLIVDALLTLASSSVIRLACCPTFTGCTCRATTPSNGFGNTATNLLAVQVG